MALATRSIELKTAFAESLLFAREVRMPDVKGIATPPTAREPLMFAKLPLEKVAL
jgi:hypothetical protein